MRTISEEGIKVDGHRRIFSLLGKSGCSIWVNQNAFKNDVFPEGGEGISKSFTPKELEYKCDTLPKRGTRISGRFIKMYATIEYLFFSTRNVVAVDDGMGQFSDLFQMLMSAHEEYNALLEVRLESRGMNIFMRLTTSYFPLRGKYDAGCRMV